MPNLSDVRNLPEAEELRKRLPAMSYSPLVGPTDLREIVKVFDNLPDLEYPINSAGELIEKMGGSQRSIGIDGAEVDPMRMIKFMPAYYFPITSVENFIEKMAELIRDNRMKVDVPTELASLQRQLPRLDYPIESRDELVEKLSAARTLTFQGHKVDPRKVLDKVRDPDLFPIRSQDDFDQKIAQLMSTRELIVKD
jgi:hypothetical protein